MVDTSSQVLSAITNLTLQDAVIQDETIHPPASMLLGQQSLSLAEEYSNDLVRPPPPVTPPPDMWDKSKPALGREPFVTVVDIGTATPLDVTIVLYANRVLMAEAFPHGQGYIGGENGKNPMVHRWCLPANVDEDSIRSFLGEGKLLIAAFPLPPNFDWPFKLAPAILGPPLRTAWPCPIMKC